MLNIPNEAIACFEKLTGLNICCYVFSPVFARLFRWRQHLQCQCRLVKENHSTECIHFDTIQVAENIWRFPEGCVKTCHGRFSELALPVIHNGKMLCILLAGLFRLAPGGNELPEIKAVPTADTSLPDGIRIIGRDELLLQMEALKQLRARLLLWYMDMHENELIREQLSQKEQILLIICREASRKLTLKKLAAMLHLSYPRTSHLVKELTGSSFSELMQKQRLENACNLLTLTRMSVAGIAAESGFGNAVNFYRIFKRTFALTPQEFRAKHSSKQP